MPEFFARRGLWRRTRGGKSFTCKRKSGGKIIFKNPADYWKKHYNTKGGKGGAKDFIDKYDKYKNSKK